VTSPDVAAAGAADTRGTSIRPKESAMFPDLMIDAALAILVFSAIAIAVVIVALLIAL
jgi:hypothetical protein